MNTLLNKLYKDPKYGVAFSSLDKIFKKAREFYPEITKKYVDSFLNKKLSHVSFLKKKNRFPKRKILAFYPQDQISIDLLQLSKYQSRTNYPITFIFCQCDNFSRLVQLFPLKSKDIKEVKKALIKSFSLYKPNSILCDREASFYSKEIGEFLKKNNVKIFSQKSAPTLKWKNGIIENKIREIRRIIAKICEEYDTENFIKYLNIIEKICNNRYNRSTKFSPMKLHYDRDAIATYQQQISNYLQNAKSQEKLGDLSVGDYVRYREFSHKFAKEVDSKFSRSIHTVVVVKKSAPVVFKLFPPPLNQNRYFYREELFKVDSKEIGPGQFPLEKVLSYKSLPNGEKLFKCSIIGSDKVEWLTYLSLKNRYILFPDTIPNLTSHIQNDLNMKGMLTRNRVKISAKNSKMQTRSQKI